jgi:four helix bundle protein
MSPRDIHERVFEFSCRVVLLHRKLSRGRGVPGSLLNQLVRAGTAIGSNLEESKAAQSKADFIAKARIALKEARESHYWLRVFAKTELVPARRLQPLIDEANEIVAILTRIVINAAAKPPNDS